MKLRALPVICLLALSVKAWAADPVSSAPPLHFCFEDVVQGYWTKPNGSGLALDLLRKVESRLGEHFVYESMPWKRCLEEVRVGAMDAAIGAADSAERREFAVYPTLPDGSADTGRAIWTDFFNVFYRAGSAVKWDGKELVVPGGTVMAQRSYFIVNVLRDRGYKVVESTKSAVDGLRFVAQGSIEVAVLQGVEAEWLCANDARFRDLVRKGSTPYFTTHVYLMPGRISFDRDPKRVQAIWNEIRNVRATPEYRKLEEAAVRNYNGN